MPTKRKKNKRTILKKLQRSKGSITFALILGVIIVGSVLLVSGIIPKDQLTPQDPDAPTFRPIINEEDQDRNTLQLRTIDFESCSQTAAVVLLLDTTGSMGRAADSSGKTKMDKLKESTILFTNNFTDDTVVGIQRFSSREISELIEVNYYRDVKDIVSSRINALPNIGGTPTADGLRFSLNVLRKSLPNYPGRHFSFVFVSDGFPEPSSQDPRLPNNAPDPSTEIKNLGVTVYSIGIMDQRQINDGRMKQLLDHVASSPDKSYIAPDGNQLTEIYQQIGQELCNTAV